MRKLERILVPVDFSPHSAKALDLAMELARSFGAELHLLHCYQTNPIGIAPYEITSPIEFEREVASAAARLLSEWGSRVTAQGIPAHEHLTPRFPTEAIQTLARELDIDLIAMGTRGRTGLPHVLLGSVTERTLRQAPCPVLTVHADESD